MFALGEHAAHLRAAGVTVVELGFQRGASTPGMLWRNLRAFGRLVRYLRRERPAVLHAFLFHSYVTAAPAARLGRVPVLVAGRRSMGDFKGGRWSVLALERWVTRMTDLLIANARAVAADARDEEGVPAEKVTVIYNALPDEAFEPAVPSIVETPSPVVLCVANLKPYKGHSCLLDAAGILRRRGHDVTLLCAGDGPERVDLERRADRLGVDARFLGARTDIHRLLACADAFVLPSLTEGLSNAVMEAMAAGKPVVATDVGGTGELIADRGVLVPPPTPSRWPTRSSGCSPTGRTPTGSVRWPGPGSATTPTSRSWSTGTSSSTPNCGSGHVRNSGYGLHRPAGRRPGPADVRDDRPPWTGQRRFPRRRPRRARHARLAIVDVAGGAQPVYNEDRTVAAIFNGELYNFADLRADLRRRGHTLASDGDSECLVHLYEEYGDDLVHHLRGMYAFAIWDAKRRRLLVARDRLGKKLLYWRCEGGAFSFASELKALVQDHTLCRELDLEALHHYLTYQYVPAPWSIYKGVSRCCWSRPGSGWSASGRSARSCPVASTRRRSWRRWRCRVPRRSARSASGSTIPGSTSGRTPARSPRSTAPTTTNWS
jgi:hypothetical protein